MGTFLGDLKSNQMHILMTFILLFSSIDVYQL
uniref:Uncharacterized protein n=1 Tax=Rhizophora mucronata TaxID=61149 RepID=A0A2P2NSS0_RHIMU